MNIISFQLIPTSDYFTRWFKLDDEGNTALNYNFKSMGYGALYFLQNTGTLVLVMVLPFILLATVKILAYLCQNDFLN